VVLGNTASEDLVFNYNIHRVKTLGEIYLESQYYLKVFGNKQGKRTDLLSDEEKSLVDKIEGDKFDKVAALVGGSVSGQTLRRVNKAFEAEDEAKNVGNEELLNLKLVEKLLAEEITPSNAENLLKNYNKYSKEREDEKDKKIVISEYSNEKCKIYNKSSAKMSEVESESIQTVFTSPPYWNCRTYDLEFEDESQVELGHEKTPEEFVDNLMVHLREVHRVLKQKGSFFMNFGEYGFKIYSPLVSNMLILRLHQEGLFKCVNEIIFHKTNGKPVPTAKRLMRSYEKIFHLVKDPENYDYYPLKIWRNEPMKILKSFKNRGVDGTTTSAPCLQKPYTTFKDFIDQQQYEDVIHTAVANTNIFKKIDPNYDHSAPYDSKACLLGILSTSLPSQTVMDVFLGSGSTAECALLLGREFVGFEYAEKNVEFTHKRLPITTSGFNMEAVEQFEQLKCD
jgi:DNA modification methylase